MGHDIKIKAHLPFIGKTGYASHARNLFTALNKLTTVKIRNFTCGDNWSGNTVNQHDQESYVTDEHKNMLVEQTLYNNSEKGRGEYLIYAGKDGDILESPDIHIVLGDNYHFYFFDEYNGPKIAYNVWETTRYQDDFFKQLLTFDQMWVPTNWSRNNLIEQGYPAERVKVVPEGVNGNIFFPEEVELLDEYKDDRFKFIVFGRWDYRKSIPEIVEAFLNEFDSSEPVDLVLSVDNPFETAEYDGHPDGLNSTEERLEFYGFDDERLKVKHFPSREDYIKYLKTGHVFLSCARSEGWNLPLIEAMACGTPSIYSDWGAQLEFAIGKGHPVKVLGEEPAMLGAKLGAVGHGGPIEGNFCKPDYEDLPKVMRDVYSNYKKYKKKAVKDSIEIRKDFAWEVSAKTAYDTVKQFLEQEKAKPIFTNPTSASHANVISQPTGERHYVHCDSKSLGDTLAWFPYVEEYRKKTGHYIICSTFWNDLFRKEYPDIEFAEPGDTVSNIQHMEQIGWFHDERNPRNPIEIPLQQTATDILNLPRVEVKPKLTIPKRKSKIKGKYVCLAIHATAQYKYWNHVDGWQPVVDWLIKKGYKVVLISREKEPFGVEPNWNWSPKRVVDKTGNIPLQERMIDIRDADFFIGLNSGLAWLSWAIGTPTYIVLAGHPPWFLPKEIKSIYDPNVCHGCVATHKFDPGDWMWCPEHKGTDREFECTKVIEPQSFIDMLIREEDIV